MNNKRKEYIYRGLMGLTLTATALALSSGGMYFIENLSIQFFGDEPTPAVTLWVIAFSTIVVAAFMIFSVWLNEKEEATSKEMKLTAKEWQELTLTLSRCISGKEINEIVLDNVGEVPLNEMEDGERILLKCFIYRGDGLKHAFYRVLVKTSDEKGDLLVDQANSSNWRQEDTKTFGPWGNLVIRNNTNYDDGSKYKEVPY